jgi:hypothetical protein
LERKRDVQAASLAEDVVCLGDMAEGIGEAIVFLACRADGLLETLCAFEGELKSRTGALDLRTAEPFQQLRGKAGDSARCPARLAEAIPAGPGGGLEDGREIRAGRKAGAVPPPAGKGMLCPRFPGPGLSPLWSAGLWRAWRPQL